MSGSSVLHYLLEFTQTHVHWVSDAIQPSHPLLLPLAIFPRIRVFSDESVLRIRSPKYWSFSFSVSPSNGFSGLTSFRMDWLDLLTVQGTLKSLLQHHCSKASVLQCSAFFIVQLSHPYMSTGKTIALTRRTFVGKGMSLLFNMLSRLVITFLPRSKRLLGTNVPPFELPSHPGHHGALTRAPRAAQHVLTEAVLVAQSCPTLQHQAPLSMGFSRQEY